MDNQLFNLTELYSAYSDCRRTKRNTINALKFEFDLEDNIFSLLNDLNKKTYNPQRSICFIVIEPTPREIFAAEFRDRIVHHLLINNIEKIFEKKFIFDSGACRKNKGTHFCTNRLKKSIRQITQNHTRKVYYCQLDISGFFMSINKKTLYKIFANKIRKEDKPKKWKEKILWLSRKIIFNNPTENYLYQGDKNLQKLIPNRKSLFKSKEGRGLPIGNYSSQFFANIYLNELDQFVKRKLKCKHYLRYVDDFILLSTSKEKLKLWRNEINKFLQEELELELNPRKTKIQPIDKGIDFLGYFIKPSHSLVRKRVIKNLKRKLTAYNTKEIPEKPLKKILATINSYYGHFKHANSFNLRKHLYEKHFGILKNFLIPANSEFNYFKISLC